MPITIDEATSIEGVAVFTSSVMSMTSGSAVAVVSGRPLVRRADQRGDVCVGTASPANVPSHRFREEEEEVPLVSSSSVVRDEKARLSGGGN